MRIQGSWDFNTRYVTTTLEEQSKTFMTREKRGKNSPLINVDGVKVYMDGVPNDAEGGAPMIDRYASAPTFGTPSIDESTFSTWMLRFDSEGLKVMAHATGSLSVRHWLNAVEAVRRANGTGPRHHLAHSMLIYPERGGPVQLRALELRRRGFAVPTLGPGSRYPPMGQAGSAATAST